MNSHESDEEPTGPMVYEFWDMRTSNLVAAYETETEALDFVRDAVREGGERAVRYLMLIEDDQENDRSRVIGIWTELLDLIGVGIEVSI